METGEDKNQAKKEPDSLELLESAGCVQACFFALGTLGIPFVTRPPSAESLTMPFWFAAQLLLLVFQICCVCHVSASRWALQPLVQLCSPFVASNEKQKTYGWLASWSCHGTMHTLHVK